jgi:hypothetical protein
MDIWDYDRKTGVLLGRSAADPNPEEPGKWLLPAFATTIRPPHVPEGCVAIFSGGLNAVGEWRIELDEGQVSGLGLKECAALSALVSSYIEDRKYHEDARSAVMDAAEDVIDRATTDLSPAAQRAVRNEAKFLVRSLIYGESIN